MSINSTVTRVWEIAAPLVAEAGMEILEIECRYEGKKSGKVLRLYLDKEGGPNLDELGRVSRQLSDLLDIHEPVPGPYTLEISSPGINRVLKTREHFVRFVGKRVRIRTRHPIDGRRSFLGLLKEVGPEELVVQENSAFRIPFAEIEKANYEHDWSSADRRRQNR